MTLSTDARNAEVIVTPPNEIDMSSGDVLARAIERACALRPSTVVVDFSEVTFCDSTAVDVLLSALDSLTAQGCALVVRNPCTMLQRVATVLGHAETLGIPASRSPDDSA